MSEYTQEDFEGDAKLLRSWCNEGGCAAEFDTLIAEVERRAAEKAWNKLADVAFPLFEAAEAVLLADADKQTLMRPLANLGAQTNPYRRNEGENDVDMDVQRVR